MLQGQPHRTVLSELKQYTQVTSAEYSFGKKVMTFDLSKTLGLTFISDLILDAVKFLSLGRYPYNLMQFDKERG